jgi:hypothetical protein
VFVAILHTNTNHRPGSLRGLLPHIHIALASNTLPHTKPPATNSKSGSLHPPPLNLALRQLSVWSIRLDWGHGVPHLHRVPLSSSRSGRLIGGRHCLLDLLLLCGCCELMKSEETDRTSMRCLVKVGAKPSCGVTREFHAHKMLTKFAKANGWC